ncbi:MAG: UDP-3-O-(3-hydroxymyristoyl)glucosamine N-acyltransferase [Sedimentisphaerales bacterium]|nr:UDP-3-O-(3-hydroxymyristoyl)glucosamine N-acyltransferase [Sedimentisphaerales bacterium]
MTKDTQKKYTVTQLAEITGARLVGSGSAQISRAAPIDSAQKDCITFAVNEKLLENIADCNAAAAIVSKEVKTSIPLLVVDNVEKALITVLKQFMPELTPPVPGIHKTAVAEEGTSIDKTASIGPLACIKKGAKIGLQTVIGAGCKIGENSVIGADCRIEDNVVIYHNCTIGNNCVIAANSTIGATGFGYYFIDGRHKLIPHTGTVVIEDCVEIGANCCVDRAKFGHTLIGAGTKVDNLVQIAHNVIIGKCCLIAGQVGLAGSAKLGNGVVLAGQVGVKDHVTIGDMTQVGAQAGIVKNIEPNQKVVGSPAIDAKEKIKQVLIQQKLPEMSKQLKQLIKRVEELEASKNNSPGG